MSPDGGYPHLLNELKTIAMVRQLSLEDCGHLFPMIRRLKTENACEIVYAYLQDKA